MFLNAYEIGISDTEGIPMDDSLLVVAKDFIHKGSFSFENGGEIPSFNLRYETYGTLNENASNAILICHALSGDHHCAGKYAPEDKKNGWWDNVIGPHKAIDTNQYFVICSNCIGGCQGSTGPSSTNESTGQNYNLDFPALTIQDMVRAQKLLIEHLGIEVLHGVVGGSMGGMLTLQWSITFPSSVRKIIALATTARQSAQAIAFNEVGRSAIIQDPCWENGSYDSNKGPEVGLAIARMMAHITYLSDKGMDFKFGRNRRKSTGELFDVEFEVESYLRYQGQSFVNRFDANTYLYLTKALDRFDLYGEDNSLEKVFSKMEAKALVIGFTSDWLFPPNQNRSIVEAMLRAGKHATYTELQMDLGHDSFLVDAPDLYDLLKHFLSS